MPDNNYLCWLANLMLQHVFEFQYMCEFQHLYGENATEMLLKYLGEVQKDVTEANEIIYKKEKKS